MVFNVKTTTPVIIPIEPMFVGDCRLTSSMLS